MGSEDTNSTGKLEINKRHKDRRVFRRPVSVESGIRKAVLILALASATVGVSSLIAFAYFYNHYSKLVEQRVQSGFWHSRGGVYAAPRRVRVGSRASVDSVEEALKRSGFLEGSSDDGVFNGSFTRKGNIVAITPSRVAPA